MIRVGCVAYRPKSSLESSRVNIWIHDEQWEQSKGHHIATLHGPTHPSFLSTPLMLPGWLSGASHLLLGARAALSNWMPRPRLLKNLSICPPAWEPHESLKGCAWLRHRQGGRKRVSWPCCVTWTLSSGSCRGVACLLCGSHGSTYRVSPCACMHSTVREGPAWGPSLLVCGRLSWF